MRTLLENKNHIIDRLPSLSDAQKEEIKSFFSKHPSYESKIDWNNKSLSYKNFEPILALDGKSKTQAKKRGIAGLTENVDYKYLGESYNEEIGNYRLYKPLTYLGSMTLASNKMPPVKENGAKWCIAYQKTSQYWDDYTGRGIEFIFVFTDDTKYAVTLYPKTYGYKPEVYTFNDQNIKQTSWLNDAVLLKIGLDPVETGQKIEDVVAKYIKQGVLIENPDGTYSKIGLQPMYIDEFIKNGRIAIPFDYWKGDFRVGYDQVLTSLENAPRRVSGGVFCNTAHLMSLEGAPQEVQGGFFCSNNSLTSLKGMPSKIGGSINCSYNRIQSLEGAPKIVNGSFSCSYCGLTSLEGGPQEIRGDFDCCWNYLTSLTGGPVKVVGDYNCSENRLTSLKGSPETVAKDFFCSDNRLTTLEGGPKSVDGSFDCSGNRLIDLKGAPKVVRKNFHCEGNNLSDNEKPDTEIKGKYYW